LSSNVPLPPHGGVTGINVGCAQTNI
jgi:hypothetical protein